MTNIRVLPARDLNAVWVKSSYSNGGNNCVEVADLTDAIAVRDSKQTDGPALVMSACIFESFITGVRDGGLGA